MKTVLQAVAAIVLVSSVALAADWQVSVDTDSDVTISSKGTPVAASNYVFWGPKWAFAGAKIQVEKGDAAERRLSGTVAGLGIKVAGAVAAPAPGTLRITYNLDAAKELDGVIGGGLEFNLKLDSPSLPAGTSEPVLLDGERGWRWPVGDGQAVTVSFSEPVAKVYFERGQKQKIRAMFYTDKVPQGTKTVVMTVELPKGGEVTRAAGDRYGPADTAAWHAGALAYDKSPVDVSFLGKSDRPAGRHGFIQAKGDQLVFQDGTPARFWGGNIAAYAIFSDKDEIQRQARRIAQLGYNLMRIHHHDSMSWVSPTVIDKTKADSQHFDAAAVDRLDWWIKCLRDEGVYVWLDLHVGRIFKDGDQIEGFDEAARRKGEGKGFCFFNRRIEQLMKDFNAAYLSHVNPYTGKAYKEDPTVIGLLITNENDLTHHFGNLFLGDKNNPFHRKLFLESLKAFCAATGLPPAETERTWLPGSSKIFLNNAEHLFNASMLAGLRTLGVRVPVATTNYWGNDGLHSLPALTDGGIIDTHSYGNAEALSVNPRYQANYIAWIAAGQVAGFPLASTEWNVPYPTADRFTAPLYVLAAASLQGWDEMMIYNYSQEKFAGPPSRPSTWSTYSDPGLTALMPAVAVAFRQGHISQARQTYCLQLDRKSLYYDGLSPQNAAAIRTLAEQSRLVIGLPDIKELDWDRQSAVPAGAKVVTDPNQDFIAPGQNFVESDTGEIKRDWAKGVLTINTPRTQAACGWIGGEMLALADATLRITTAKAAVVLTSLDGKPLAESRRVLLTTVARVVASPGGKMPLLSEPVAGTLTLRSRIAGLKLVPVGPDGAELDAVAIPAQSGAYAIALPAGKGTHWFLLVPDK